MERALFSLFRKEGSVADLNFEVARLLADRGCELMASTGTLAAMRARGITTRDLDEFIGRKSNLLDGRVRTISEPVLGGLLAKRYDERHQQELREFLRGAPIDVVVMDFYPHDADADGSHDDFCEHTDIGGPLDTLAAWKNAAWPVVPTTIGKFWHFLQGRRRGSPLEFQLELRAGALKYVAEYYTSRAATFEFNLPRWREELGTSG